jgi:hypothetical protein
MSPISEFYPYVLPHAMGCSVPLVEQVIRDICIDFCEHAPIAQEVIDPIDLKTGVVEYDLDVQAGVVVSLILDAKYNGNTMRIGNAGDFPDPRLMHQMPVGDPCAVMQLGEAKFVTNLAPATDQKKAIRLLVSTKPTKKATSVADILAADYSYDISLGVLSRLLLMPNQPFSNPALATIYRNDYEIKRTAARIRAEASFGRTSSVIRPRRFI